MVLQGCPVQVHVQGVYTPFSQKCLSLCHMSVDSYIFLSFLMLFHSSSRSLDVWQSTRQRQLLPSFLYHSRLTSCLAVSRCCCIVLDVRYHQDWAVFLLFSYPVEPVGNRSAHRSEVFSEWRGNSVFTELGARLVVPLIGQCLQVYDASPVLRDDAGTDSSQGPW